MNIAFANRLLEYRKQHNLSQEELAEKIGVSRQAVSKWERAEASPDTDNLILLAEIYGVTLDELIKGKSEEEPAAESESSAPADKVSFVDGIHVENKDGDSVHINWKQGINVHDKNGDNVHVGFDGVHVEENGHIFPPKQKPRALAIWNKFPFWGIALICFLLWGFSGVLCGWALSWICFLTIPLYYSLGSAIFSCNPNHFAYPVLTVMLYMIFGFLNICGGWELGWIVFLTIPIYYGICAVFGHKECE